MQTATIRKLEWIHSLAKRDFKNASKINRMTLY